jgi:hypothetical protein
MKRAVSISIGSSRRDKTVQIDLLGKTVQIERRGTDGDMKKAAALFKELDGQVDAFGVGGTDLGVLVDQRWHRLYSIESMVRDVKKTPIVDGNGLKNTLEIEAADCLGTAFNATMRHLGKRALLVSSTDRWGLAQGFVDAGYECLFGDMMFSLGLPVPIDNQQDIKRLAAVLMPIAGRIPFKWVYPIGKEQEKRTPKWGKYFEWATVIAGDCHYITRYMPDHLDGKVIVTNTTTPDDVALFRTAGVKLLVTTTPVLDGRSFGTNMMEAAILAAAGRTEPVDYANAGPYLAWLKGLVGRIGLHPQVQELN